MGEDLDIGPVTQAGPVGSGSGSGSGAGPGSGWGPPARGGSRPAPDLLRAAGPGLSEVG